MLGIKNCMEDLVEELLEEVLNEMYLCKCEKCKNDICAIALNNLKPMYAVSDKGKVLTKTNLLKQQYRADVIAQITKATKKVGQDTRHE